MTQGVQTRRHWLVNAMAGATAVAGVPGWARSASYPHRPIHLVVPFAAGGSSDLVARLVADAMQPFLGQALVVENKGGAGGMIGSEAVARAPADGYTLGLGTISTLAVNPVVLPANRIDPLQDLQPVVPLASIASVFCVSPALRVRDFAHFLQIAREQGDNWAAGSSGVGSIGHVILAALNARWGTQMRHIPFKGMGPVINSALAGQTQFLSDQYPSSAPHIQAGRLQAVAVAAPRRLPGLPQVPTLAELGYADLNALAMTWFGLVVPARTPQSVALALNHAANQALQQTAVREKLSQWSVDPLGGTPEQLHAMMISASQQVQQVVHAQPKAFFDGES